MASGGVAEEWRRALPRDSRRGEDAGSRLPFPPTEQVPTHCKRAAPALDAGEMIVSPACFFPYARPPLLHVPAAPLGGIRQPLSIRFNNLLYEMKHRGSDGIVLSLGEAFFGIPPFGSDAAPIPGSRHYAHSRGNPRLRRLLAA